MKKSYLILLAVCLGLGVLAVFWVYRSNKLQTLKQKPAPEVTESPNRQFLRSYITPGVTKNKHKIVSVNGPFLKFESIPNSADYYLKLDLPHKNIPKLRVVVKPKPDRGITKTTEVSIIRPSKQATSLTGALRLVGEMDKLSEDNRNLIFRPGIWTTAILYLDQKGNNLKDQAGAYYVRALTTKEN